MQKLLVSIAVVFVLSVAVAGVIFLKQGPEETAQAQAVRNQVTCATGFDRPELFGISADGPEGLTETGKLGSTMAGVSVNWNLFQPDGPGRYNPDTNYPEGVQFPINKWNETGQILHVNISGTPHWAKDNPALPPGNAQPRRDDPTVEREFRKFVRDTVVNSQGKVKYWSYWNEPNGCMSSVSSGECGYNEGTARAMIHWMNIFYDEVKAAQPDAIVIGGNLEAVKPETGFIGYMNKYDAKYDILGINAYDKAAGGHFPVVWVKQMYDAQEDKKPVFINEWGFDSIWGMSYDTMVNRMEEAFGLMRDNPWIMGASYHNLRDVGGDYGLVDKTNDGYKPRPHGAKFQQIVESMCDPQYSQGTGSGANVEPDPPPARPSDTDTIITVRTFFQAEAYRKDNVVEWPRIRFYRNNGANFDLATPTDSAPCDGTYNGVNEFCGSIPLYEDKLIHDFGVTQSFFFKDNVVPASQLVQPLQNNIGVTKLSYAFYNDRWDGGSADSNVYITKIEIWGPDQKLLYTFTPENVDTYEDAYADLIRPLDSAYFDMGRMNREGEQTSDQFGMVNGFDKKEFMSMKANKSKENSRWELGSEGTFNLLTFRLNNIIRDTYGGVIPAKCSVSSNNLGSTPLKRGDTVRITAVANVPINNAQFSFYNRDNRDENNTPKYICIPFVRNIRGPSEVVCPPNTSALVITQGQGTEAIQSFDMTRFPNGQVQQNLWRGDIGWIRDVEYNNNLTAPTSEWREVAYLNQLDIIGKSNKEIDATGVWFDRNGLATFTVWRDNAGYVNYVPATSDSRAFDWTKATGWQKTADLNENPGALPGDGRLIAYSIFSDDSQLWITWWRGNEQWRRAVPLGSDGKPQYNNAKEITRVSGLENIPGEGDVQAVDHIRLPNGTVLETLWRNDQVWQRTIPVQNRVANFDQATNYEYASQMTSNLPRTKRIATIDIPYETFATDLQTGSDGNPNNIQVNATFETADGESIGNDVACVSYFTVDDSIKGDFNNDCIVDIYDYSYLVENNAKETCEFDLTGDCRIDDKDQVAFRELFGNSCEAQ